MIPVGHSAIDRAGIAELHGLSWRQARRAQPWAQPGHPDPLTRGRPANGKPQLWDYEQAEQFARREPVTPLEGGTHERDLLDYVEAAHWAGVEPTAWIRDVYRDRVPGADEDVLGGSFWYRQTVDAWRQNHDVPRRGGGRPHGATDRIPRGDTAERVRAVLREASESGVAVSTAEVARRVGIHYTTAHRHVAALRDE